MKWFNSDVFGEIYEPENFSELTQVIINSNDSFGDGDQHRVRMWRGQSNITWPIHSSAYRRLKISKSKVSEKDVVFYEESLIKAARHKGHDRVEGVILSDLELLARLQHHGAATRLIDTSKNSLVALWFASNTNFDVTGLLIGLHADYLGGYEGEKNDDNYTEIANGLRTCKNSITWEPMTITKRIASQHSQFLYSKVVEEPSGSLILPSEKGATFMIAISPKLKKESIKILNDVYDIRELTLFPDLDGFCKSNSVTKDQWYNYRW